MLRKTAVKWTEDEENALIEEVHNVINKKPLTSPLNALRVAQKNILEPYRHRNIQSYQNVEWLYEEFKDMIKTKTGKKPIFKEKKSKDSSKKKIKWTKDEIIVLKAKMMEILKMLPGGKMTPLRALRKAQKEVLPKERQRNIQSYQSVTWLDKNITIELSSKPTEENKKETPQEQPEIKVPESVYNISNVATDALFKEVGRRILVGPMQKLIEESVKKNIENVFETKGLELVQQIVGAIKGSGIKTLTENKLNKDPRTKVLIVGLKNEQIQEVQRAYGDMFILKFISNQNKSTKNLITKVSGEVQDIVVMTKFISHSTYQGAKAITKAKFHHCNGGVTELTTILEKILYSHL